MSKYETINRLEWREDEDCIRVVDSDDEDAHIFWFEDFESLRESPNFGPDTTVIAFILDEVDPCGGEFLGGSYSTYKRDLKEVLDIIQARDTFLAAMARKRESILLESIKDLFKKNNIMYCYFGFTEIAEGFLEVESTKSVLIDYLKIVTRNYSTDDRLKSDFYIDKLDEVECELFPSENTDDETDDE